MQAISETRELKITKQRATRFSEEYMRTRVGAAHEHKHASSTKGNCKSRVFFNHENSQPLELKFGKMFYGQ